MNRLYPQVGRNFVISVEPLALGTVKICRSALGAVVVAVRSGRLADRFIKLLHVICGVAAIVIVHLLPGRWRRVVLWEFPNFGEFSMGTEYLLRWLEQHPEKDPGRYVFITSSSHNRTLLRMVRRKVCVIENRFLYWCRPPFNTSRAAIFWGYYGPMGDYDDVPPQISFSPSETAEGETLMREMGLGLDQSFVCVHWRDSAFHTHVGRNEGKASTIRNTDMETMLPTLQSIAESGFSVVRMGSVVREPLPEDFCRTFPSVIDYARSYRTDFGDVFLSSRCKLFVGTNSGLFCAAQTFNCPLVLVDYHFPQFLNQVTARAIVILKRYRFRNDRYLTYAEMFARFPWSWDDDKLRKAGIETESNTAEEILAVVRQGLDLIHGIDSVTEEDRKLQKRFWDSYPQENIRGHKLPRIGRDFLRENQHLF